jgi:hypothetical protein
LTVAGLKAKYVDGAFGVQGILFRFT